MANTGMQVGFYLAPQPLGLLRHQLSQVCVVCIQEGVEGSLVVSCLSGHPSALQPALPGQFFARGPAGQK